MKRFKTMGVIGIAVFLAVTQAAAQTIPRDPQVEQWGFRQTGVFDAWDSFRGSNEVIVAVIDNGFDSYHPELADNVWKNEEEIPGNGIDDDNNGYIDDVYGWDFTGITPQTLDYPGDNDPRPEVRGVGENILGGRAIHHGTAVAGIIGAKANNNVGIAGVNWHVKLMNIRVIDSSGEGELIPLDEAIRYAVDNGADVINFSLVGNEKTTHLEEAIDYAYEKGVAMAAAVGNGTLSLYHHPFYPACHDAGEKKQKVIGVSAMNQDFRSARFSNSGNCVDITAPGVNIHSVARYAPQFGLVDQTIMGLQGTSFATPFVSATLALLKGIRPEWGPDELYDALLTTTHVTPSKPSQTYRDLYGYGRLQIDKAVAKALEGRPLKSETAVGAFIQKGAVLHSLVDAKNTINLRGTGEVAAVHGHESIAFVQIGDGPFASFTFLNERGEETGGLTTSVEMPVQFDAVVRAGKLQVALSTGEMTRVYDERGNVLQHHDIGGIPSLHGEEQLSILEAHDGIQIHTYGADAPSRTFTVPGITTVSDMLVRDIDGDGEIEFVIASGQRIMIRNAAGSLQRMFRAFDVGGGDSLDLTMTTSDIDKNGISDVLVVDKNGKTAVRAWTAKTKNIGEWLVDVNGRVTLVRDYSQL